MITAAVALFILSSVPADAQTEAVLHSFNYAPFQQNTACPPSTQDGLPYAGLLLYKGHLYGTTPEGGAGEKGVRYSRDGMAFKLNPPESGETVWGKTTLHSFLPDTEQNIDGNYPCSNLIEENGKFYGTTVGGGEHDLGVLFALTPPPKGQTDWTESLVYTFTGLTDGGRPFGGLTVDNTGTFYGANYWGVNGAEAGLIFQINCDPSLCIENTLYSAPLGTYINGGLLVDNGDGSIFGTSPNGGQYGYGNVFQLTLSAGKWNYYDLYDFTGGADGAYPNGGLLGSAGDLFGTAQRGGDATAPEGSGVLFELRELTPGSPYTLFIQHTFTGLNGSPDGSAPAAGFYQDASGSYWGTCEYGGSEDRGTIFELYPDRYKVHVWHYQQMYSFIGGTNDGAYPEATLTGDSSGNLYGTTSSGGTASDGTIFEFTP
ncbi:MAG TPA: choice-of-anchor tandem repeat GloVer-containing protein [Terriglobales bacterium]